MTYASRMHATIRLPQLRLRQCMFKPLTIPDRVRNVTPNAWRAGSRGPKSRRGEWRGFGCRRSLQNRAPTQPTPSRRREAYNYLSYSLSAHPYSFIIG